MDLTALFQLSYGVYAVTSAYGPKKAGCIANCAIQVTAVDPYMLVSLNKDNVTTEVIQKAKRFAVSILTENVPMDVIGTFGYRSSKDVDKFSHVETIEVADMPVLKTGANAYFVCDLVQVFEANSHLLILGQVTACENFNSEPPMTYAYYHQVKKGKAPKNAPTYVAEASTGGMKDVYVCEVCGYRYEGDLRQAKDDFHCPVCGVGKARFHRER